MLGKKIINTGGGVACTTDTTQILGGGTTIAYYKMADASDETGSYNGTASTVDFNVQGKYGFAAEFNGSSSYMSFPAPYSHTSNEDNITVSWWMNGDTAFSNGSFWGILGGEIANSSGNAGTININAYGKGTNQVYISLTRIWGNSARYHASSSTSSSDWVTMIPGQWYHNVLTYDPATNSSKYYVDGTLIYNITFTTYTTSGNYTNSTLAWGKYRNGVYYFNGKIDQARFFNKVISADEVTKLYNEVQCAPAIDTPENYFNTKLYTGNGGTQSITGLGFKPDLTWIKSRDSADNHNLGDSVRGVQKFIYSNLTSQQLTSANYLTSFDTDGFSIGSDNSINKSSDSIVSWNWKAGGILNQSASFNGSTSKIDLNNTFANNVTQQTWSAWAKFDNLNTQNFILFNENSGGGDGFGFFDYGNGNIYFQSDNTTNSNRGYISNSGLYSINEWVHFTMVFDGTATGNSNRLKAYVNGVALTLTIQGTIPATTNSTSSTTQVGSRGGGISFSGSIDQVRIFNKALSASEVTTLYNETSSTINTLQVLGDTSCVAAYPLGTNANDLSTSYNGTASNITFNQPGHLTRNTNGTIESTVSASPESGFSIVNWGATTTGSDTVGHGLLAKPQIIIMKNASSSSTNWFVYSDIFDGSYDFLYLNTEAAKADSSRNVPTATVFDQGNLGGVSAGNNCIAYCFANVDGYQRIGSFVGNGNANGPFVYTGFEPAWVLIKKVSSGSPTGGWVILDNKRNPANPRNSKINANSSAAENTNNAFSHNFYSNGFQVVTSDVDYNHSGKTYLFWAIAANPDTTEPTKANSFKTVLYTGNGGTQSITGVGFKPDFVWTKMRSGVNNHQLFDSIRGVTKELESNTNAAEVTNADSLTAFDSNGFTVGTSNNENQNGVNYVSWNWKGLDHDRQLTAINTDGSIPSIVSANTAAGFSIVKYKGNSSTGTVGHGLLAAPSIAIIKRINNTDNWQASISNITGTRGERVYLNLTQGISSDTARETAKPSATVLSVGGVDCNAEDYIVYCWHSISGYSSMGAYTGNGNATGPTITTGFEPSWVILKCSTPGTNTNWRIIDSARDTTNPRAAYLNADSSGAEETAYDQVNFLSNGFQLATTDTSINGSGNSHIYMAFK